MKTSWDEIKKRRNINLRKWIEKYKPESLRELNAILYEQGIRPLSPNHEDVSIILDKYDWCWNENWETEMKTRWDEIKKRRNINLRKWAKKYKPRSLDHLNQILYDMSIAPISPSHLDLEILLGPDYDYANKNLFMMHTPKTGGSYVTFKVVPHEVSTKLKLKQMHKGYQKRFHVYGHYHCLRNENFHFPVNDTAIFAKNYQDCRYFDQSLRFSIVRNPFDFLVSMYFYKFPYNPANCDDFPDITWEEFATQFCDPSAEWSVQPGSPLKKFLFFSIFDDEGDCQAHRVIRMETLDRDIKDICRIVGIEPRSSNEKYNSMDKKHVLKAGYNIKDTSSGRDPDWRVYYTPELRELAEKKFEKEMRAFGYSFDGFDDFKIQPYKIKYKYSTDTLTLKNDD